MTSTATAPRSARGGAAQAAHSVWLSRLGRFGLGARGVLYVLLAYLALLIAFGKPKGGANKQGALQTVARQHYGHILLAALAAGFGAYALWQLALAAFGGSARSGSNKKSKRIIALVNGVLYAFFCATTAALAAGSASSSAGGSKTAVDVTGKVMQHSYGRILVGVVGAVVILVGIVLAWRALSGKREFELRPMRRSLRDGIDTLAKAGLTARAVIVAAAGVFILQAALTFDPNKAKGLDGILTSFAHTPFGPFLLVLVALGVLAFGIYSLAAARYAEI